MSFFMDAAVTMDTKILEIIYLVTGFAVIYVGVKNLLDKENPSRIGTAVFWGILGVLIAFGRWIPEEACGALVIIMCIPAVLLMIMSRSNTPKVILNDAVHYDYGKCICGNYSNDSWNRRSICSGSRS